MDSNNYNFTHGFTYNVKHIVIQINIFTSHLLLNMTLYVKLIWLELIILVIVFTYCSFMLAGPQFIVDPYSEYCECDEHCRSFFDCCATCGEELCLKGVD